MNPCDSINKEGLVMVSISAAVTIVLYLIVGGMVFWLLDWLIGYCRIPEPFNKIARVVLAVLAVFVIIGILLQMIGGQTIFRA